MNGGVYEPLAVRIAKSLSHYDCTISCHRLVRHAPLAPREIARCTQRGFFEATAGECDEPEYNMA